LIMLVLAVAAIVVLTAVLLVLLHSAGDASGLPIQAEGASPVLEGATVDSDANAGPVIRRSQLK
jgi:hypothetical protein